MRGLHKHAPGQSAIDRASAFAWKHAPNPTRRRPDRRTVPRARALRRKAGVRISAAPSRSLLMLAPKRNRHEGSDRTSASPRIRSSARLPGARLPRRQLNRRRPRGTPRRPLTMAVLAPPGAVPATSIGSATGINLDWAPKGLVRPSSVVGATGRAPIRRSSGPHQARPCGAVGRRRSKACRGCARLA